MNQPRTYTMRSRAAAVEATRRRILDAAFDLAGERLFAEMSLDDVARAAGVSVQTVLRQFGSRAGLIEATSDHGARLVNEERRVPAGDIPDAVRVIVDHYELRGDASLLLLAQERAEETVARIVDRARALHRSWVEDAFAPFLSAVTEQRRAATLDLLVVATDLYTWKLLRRDRGLSRTDTEARMTQLLTAILAAAPRKVG